MKRRVLFCIDKFNHGGGATKLLMDLINYNDQLDLPVVYCLSHVTKDIKEPFEVVEGTSKEIIDTYFEKRYEIIHYFKADGNQLLKRIGVFKRDDTSLRVVMTVCQRPSYSRFLLSKKEIMLSNKIVFVDRTAYDDPLFAFIPSHRKTVIYCGCTDDTINFTKELLSLSTINNVCPIIGRASHLVKCPTDTFEVFDKIKNPKKIVIIGDGPKFNILKKEALKHKSYNTFMLGGLSYYDYLKEMSKFDIFLYYLPLSAHSSIDYTLGDAMLLKKPCVYYGPPAPSERIKDGVNGFVARSKDDLSNLCNKLIDNCDLRMKIGEKARESTIHNFSFRNTIKEYNALYDDLASDVFTSDISIPLYFYLYYCHNGIVVFIKRLINKIFRILKIQYQLDFD